MIRWIAVLGLLGVAACAPTQGVGYPNYPAYVPFPGQGQYVRPEYLNPVPTPLIQGVDACQSHLYRSLVGRHEGSIYIAGLPGRKRILKPAFLEGPAGLSPQSGFICTFYPYRGRSRSIRAH